ncbi:MAG: hypothetical protein H6747_14885 [Deltaproteobacteria bacterium]|nr:hypothetical protein [Deltaproteobacteria bacterium]
MKLRWQLLISLLLSVSAGAAYGHFVLRPRHQAPAAPAPTPHAATPASPVAIEAESEVHPEDDGGPARTAGEAGANGVAKRVEGLAKAEKQTAPAPDAGSNAEADTMVPEEAVPLADADPALIRRGPGHYARLDPSPAGLSSLIVREGAMERDGDGRFSPYARNPVVARLRANDGPIRVELLHLGFDRDGHATVAHVRTVGPEPKEGVISLKFRRGMVAVLPDEALEPRPNEAVDESALEPPTR